MCLNKRSPSYYYYYYLEIKYTGGEKEMLEMHAIGRPPVTGTPVATTTKLSIISYYISPGA